MTFIANPNMDRMRSKILKALGNGKKMGLSDLAAAIGETKTQTNSVIRSLGNQSTILPQRQRGRKTAVERGRGAAETAGDLAERAGCHQKADKRGRMPENTDIWRKKS